MSVDEERFEHLMEEQRQRARAAQKSAGNRRRPDELNDFQRRNADLPVTFVGYERLEVFTVIRASGSWPTGASPSSSRSRPSMLRAVVRSPTSAGCTPSRASSRSMTVVRFETDQVVVARQVEGRIVVGERAKAMVNAVRRHQTACNHTATHLLHNALRIVLGDAVRQAGSMVRPERLRFDFCVRERRRQDELRQVEDLVNRRIVENHAVRPSSPPRSTPRRSARWPSSKTNTASSCASSRSTTSVASSAAAPTSRPLRRSACSAS